MQAILRPKFGNTISNAYKLNRFSRTRSYCIIFNNNLPTTFNYFHTDSRKNAFLTPALYKDPESKAEKMGNILKEDQKRKLETTISDAKTIVPPQELDIKRPTLYERVIKELKHYYHGFKLLYFETKILFRLLGQVLRGHTLTRRERNQATRTTADLFRLLPFSVFIIVPFMEFALPIFLKFFPGMLPSTFEEKDVRQEKLKKQLKAKLEMAKFLQDTLEETALEADKNANRTEENSHLNHKFSEFMKQVRSKGEPPTNEDIMKYSTLFENEMTLDNLNRSLLIALCQILEVNILGGIPPNHILRFQLRMKIRNLEADDKMILSEGIDALDMGELQQACRDRAMRSLGLSEERLKKQLAQWLDLHLKEKIPISLLILSRALYLPENLPKEELIKTTISSLPESLDSAVRAEIAEASGEKLDNKIRLEILKQEEKEIILERAKEAEKPPTPSPIPSQPPSPISPLVEEKDFAAVQIAKEMLVDKAPLLETNVITREELQEINQIIESLPSSEKNNVKSEIAELKKDKIEYDEDIKEVEEMTLTKSAALKETAHAKAIGKRVAKMIADMDQIMLKLDKVSPPEEKRTGLNRNVVSIVEVMDTIKKLKLVPNAEKEKRIMEVLSQLDTDKDGKIENINDVLKVFDIIEQENVKIDKNQLGKILLLLEKEKIIEMVEMQEEKLKQAQSAAPSE